MTESKKLHPLVSAIWKKKNTNN